VSTAPGPNRSYQAVLWDFGGVLTESPFIAFARFEQARGLPRDFLRRVNSLNPDANAWARFERGELTLPEFSAAFEAECRVHGHAVCGEDVIELLYGEIRPSMVEALRRCAEHYTTACLTNNIKTGRGHGLPTTESRAAEVAQIMELFDFVFESSVIGVRKPEPEFYRLALERLGIEAREAVYLDDLGINLKPARALGMTTIRVESAAQALQELEAVLQLKLATAS
jgi:putative hydrolase of the HAD superfamily